MDQMPEVHVFDDGARCYSLTLSESEIIVFTPCVTELTQVINYGFRAPFFLVFEESVTTPLEAKQYAEEKGFAKVAAVGGSSVVFARPVTGGFADAKPSLYTEIIANSKIGQYYRDGVTIGRNRFTKQWEKHFIRGGVQRVNLYGTGEAGDYIATCLLDTIQGEGLYGPGDVAPCFVTLVEIGKTPVVNRRDIPVISVRNSKEINAVLTENCDHVAFYETEDVATQYKEFGQTFHRMVGNLIEEPIFESIGLVMEPCAVRLKTAPDNRGDEKDTSSHMVGYVAYYNKSIIEKQEPVPLVMCFHGGGDSAMCMASVSGWYSVAHRNNFLLVCVENHLESTATEMQELMELLIQKYPVDTGKIYSTGFSMGGCKSWDMMQEYPLRFAGIAPMSATFEVGCNSYGEEVPGTNRTEPLPVFYLGGAQTPLPELPFQAQKCLDRFEYVCEVNRVTKKKPFSLEDVALWEDPIYPIKGDATCALESPYRPGSILTMELFLSEDGRCMSVFGSVSDQSHEVRMHSCENAWKFLNSFRREADGTLTGGDFETIQNLYR